MPLERHSAVQIAILIQIDLGACALSLYNPSLLLFALRKRFWKELRQLAEGTIRHSIMFCLYEYILSKAKSGRPWTFVFGQRLETSMEGGMIIVEMNLEFRR